MTPHVRTLDDVFNTDPRAVVGKNRALVEGRMAAAPAGLVLYGAGHFGRAAAESLRRRGIIPTAFVDRDPGKRGRELCGVPIITLEDLRSRQPAEHLVVVTVYNCVAVLDQLAAQGIEALSFARVAAALGEPLVPYCGIQDPGMLWEHEKDIRAAMDVWADEESRREFLAQLAWTVDPDPFALVAPRAAQATYFEPSIVHWGNKEVFIDCGAFDGDSIASFVERCPGYREAIAVEPDPANRARLVARFGGEREMLTRHISMLPFAASDRRELVFFDVTGTAGSAIADTGMTIDAAPLDELVADRQPTFIKMDIEGAEPKALAGATDIMRRYVPRLAVCLYHDRRHLWEIPLAIARIQPRYRLRLRRYADECWELVCYATLDTDRV